MMLGDPGQGLTHRQAPACLSLVVGGLASSRGEIWPAIETSWGEGAWSLWGASWSSWSSWSRGASCAGTDLETVWSLTRGWPSSRELELWLCWNKESVRGNKENVSSFADLESDLHFIIGAISRNSNIWFPETKEVFESQSNCLMSW